MATVTELAFPYAPELWQVVPPTLPNEEFASATDWAAHVHRAYLDQGLATDPAAAEQITRMAVEASTSALPDDVATLLFRPLAMPATAIVHFQLFDAPDVDPFELKRERVLPDIRFALTPVVGEFDTPDLGVGLKAAFIGAEPFGDGEPAGGLGYAFVARGKFVNVFTNPTLPTIIGLMESHLDDLVRATQLIASDAEYQPR